MHSQEQIYVGYISRTRGLKGELQIYFEIDHSEEIDWPHLFLEIDSRRVPFFIEKINIQKNNTAFVFLEDVDDIHKAEEYLRKKVYIDKSQIPERDSDDFHWDDFLGFAVVDEHYAVLGEITKIEELPQQQMVTVNMDGKELLFPFSEDWLQEIDIEMKKLYVSLPEGLVELYRNTP